MEDVRGFMSAMLNLEDFKSDDQRDAISEILIKLNEGEKNFVLSMATQAGKSLVYQALGGNKSKGVTIIISPSLDLIDDHLCYLNAHNIKAESINKYVHERDRFKIMNKMLSYKSKTRFFFLTPEMIVRNPMIEFLEDLIDDNLINYFIVDESHRVIDSCDFRQKFYRLKISRRLDKNIPWIALTTADKNTCENIAKALKMKNPHIIIKSSVRKNIFYDVASDHEIHLIADYIKGLRNEGDNEIPTGIIFYNNKRDIVRINKLLHENGIDAGLYHSKLEKRNRVLESWKNEIFPVLIASAECFGFGINYTVPDIRFVIHIGEPKSMRHFYQESGRAGNDDKKGYSRIYFSSKYNVSDEFFTEYICKNCRRQALAHYFGENIPFCHEWCDKCVDKNAQINHDLIEHNVNY